MRKFGAQLLASISIFGVFLFFTPVPFVYAVTAPSVFGTPQVWVPNTTSATPSESYTFPSGGSNTALYVFMEPNTYLTGSGDTPPTYNGVSMTKIYNNSGTVGDGTLFCLANPPTGAHTLQINWGTGRGSLTNLYAVIAVQDVNQTCGTDATVHTGTSAGSPLSTSLTTTVDNTLVISAIFLYASGMLGCNGSPTVTDSFLTKKAQGGNSGFGNDCDALAWSSGTKTTAGSQSIGYSWTNDGGGGNYGLADLSGFSLSPVSAGVSFNFWQFLDF